MYPRRLLLNSRSMTLAIVAVMVLAARTDSLHGEVRGFKITTDRTVDTSSLESIVRDVFARSGAKTNDEKAIALYEWLHQAIFHYACPVEPRPQSVGPLKLINVYGWALCGSEHTVLKALFETAGWKCRYVGWSDPGHSTIEVFYDDRWHYFDVFLKCYFWSKDKTHVVSQDEIDANPSLVLDAVKEGRAARQHLCCGDTADGILSGVKSRRVIGDQKGWGSCTWRDENYSPLLNLPCGASLRLDWTGEPDGLVTSGRPPIHTCGTKDFRGDFVLGPIVEHYGPRGYSTGAFVYSPNFSRQADLADIELHNARADGGKLVATGQGQAVFKLSLPFAFARAKVDAGFDKGDGKLSLSIDRGKSWSPITAAEIGSAVKQRYHVWLKADFTGALTRLKVEAIVEHNRGALPYLLPGKNKLTISSEKSELPRDTVLVVSCTYQEATAAANRQRFDGRGLEYGPVKTVTREITSLPLSFDVEVGGNTPPRMLSLERAVRAR